MYQTLKRGRPNHKVLLDSTHGRAAFQGRGRMAEPYPLVIAGEHNEPRVLKVRGQGHRIFTDGCDELYSAADNSWFPAKPPLNNLFFIVVV
uniref:Gamma-glutamylaminecyclotransferase n=1 Tax=Equus asinus asinus TaxID=83772 RepID=A0A8C4LDG5_EQUAS